MLSPVQCGVRVKQVLAVCSLKAMQETYAAIFTVHAPHVSSKDSTRYLFCPLPVSLSSASAFYVLSHQLYLSLLLSWLKMKICNSDLKSFCVWKLSHESRQITHLALKEHCVNTRPHACGSKLCKYFASWLFWVFW